MNYQFENLGPDKFQEFCQTLLLKEFPNVQCFPIGQRDGGRDAVSYNLHEKESYIFQVKYVQEPSKVLDRKKWLLKIINEELPKIKKLIERGATRYYLLTNIQGTSYGEKGTMDLFSSVMEDKINIPSICYWRTDLSRRLEANNSIKWFYPELLSAKDLLDSLIFSNLNENRARREDTIRAYLSDQYELDYEVKFQQIELQNDLLDLFVDVPINFNSKNLNRRSKHIERNFQYLLRSHGEESTNIAHHELFMYEHAGIWIGAAKLLLSTFGQQSFEKIVIEGGPGQGKSTISQYISQVHRIRLLNKKLDLEKIDKSILSEALRIPFKVDLRDLASWFSGKNPYDQNETLINQSNDSLESFLVAHINYHSGMNDFNVSDLIAILKTSSVLFVFDGFDEVAESNARDQIVQKITRTIKRLEENSLSIQVIITSRPAAFANSAGFSSDIFPHFELSDINNTVIQNYLKKWIIARKLNPHHAKEIKKIVDEKLSLPHLKDLAKNPMQLAILISLINTKGQSLPDKRTALYDDYIRLFFDRESEKNDTIRDNRDLIINIHEYLAWLLHSQAEKASGTGRISVTEIQYELNGYLVNEGHDTEISKNLFTAIQERVCAIVSRVQNTFEFEVQPLREYFCAKHLYRTAPYSPTGHEKPGTHPDRFEALASNYYWTNVVRFYAGCFNKGELPMLILKLEELDDKEYLKYTNHPKLLASLLLSDWVFTQYPKLMKRVVDIIIKGIGSKVLLNHSIRGNHEPIILPQRCGRNELYYKSFEELKSFPPFDFADELIDLIKSNKMPSLKDDWISYFEDLTDENQIINWFQYGLYLELLFQLDFSQIESIDNKIIQFKPKFLKVLISASRFDYIESKHADFYLEMLISKNMSGLWTRGGESTLNQLTSYLSFLHSSVYFDFSDNDSLHDIMQRMSPFELKEIQNIDNLNLVKYNKEKIVGWLKIIKREFDKELYLWTHTLDPWINVLDAGIKIFGTAWALESLSSFAAGIKASNIKCENYNDIFDDSKSTVKRARYARLRSGNQKWWKSNLISNKSSIFSLLLFIKWGSPKTITLLISDFNNRIEQLNYEDYEKLVASLSKNFMGNNLTNSVKNKEFFNLLKNENISDQASYLISFKLSEVNRVKLFKDRFRYYNGTNEEILNFNRSTSIHLFLTEETNEKYLKYIADLYSSLSISNRKILPVSRFYLHRHKSVKLTYKLARIIMSAADKYPRQLVNIAENSCREIAYKHVVPVGQTAKNEKWFDENVF